MSDQDIVKQILLKPTDVPGFQHRGNSFSQHGVLQGFLRYGLEGEGRDPSSMRVRIRLAVSRDAAYQVVLREEDLGWQTHPSHTSFTRLPLGEEPCLSSHDAGGAKMVAWDNRLVVDIDLGYTGVSWPSKFSKGTTYFQKPSREELERVEGLARLILSRAAKWLHADGAWGSAEVVVKGQPLPGKTARERTLVPGGAVLRALGGQVQLNGRLYTLQGSWREQPIILPAGGYQLVAKGGRQVLSLPLVWDEGEVWVEGTGLAEALGLRVRMEGERLVLEEP